MRRRTIERGTIVEKLKTDIAPMNPPLQWISFRATNDESFQVEKARRGDLEFEVRRHTDGTYRLLIWRDGRSMVCGPFSAPEPAKLAAENMPESVNQRQLLQPGIVFAEQGWRAP